MLTANIDKNLRKAVYRREGFECALCGDNRGLQIHHVVPRGQGGSNAEQNLVCLCWRCHALIHGHDFYEDAYVTPEEAKQEVIEYLADYYAETYGEPWNPWEEGGG